MIMFHRYVTRLMIWGLRMSKGLGVLAIAIAFIAVMVSMIGKPVTEEELKNSFFWFGLILGITAFIISWIAGWFSTNVLVFMEAKQDLRDLMNQYLNQEPES